jgi:hypothetical protein
MNDCSKLGTLILKTLYKLLDTLEAGEVGEHYINA